MSPDEKSNSLSYVRFALFGKQEQVAGGATGGIGIKVGNMEPSRYERNDGSNAERALLPAPLFAEHGPNYGPNALVRDHAR